MNDMAKDKVQPNATVIDLAKSYQFDNAEFAIKWNGYDVFVPFMNDGSIPMIGEPVFILSNGKETRIAFPFEYRSFMNKIEG